MRLVRFGGARMFNLGYTLTLVILGTMSLGILGGFLGSVLVLRRQALMGDALSHATLPGVMLAFILFGTRSLNVLLTGALISALIALGLMHLIRRHTVLGWDAAMALMLSGFFGLGQWLLSIIQRQGLAAQGGLSRFIFGQAATMLRADVMTIVSLITLLLVLLITHIKLIQNVIFDRAHYLSTGHRPWVIETVLSAATLLFIVLGIRMVGVVLISALLIGPPLTARLWTHRFNRMLFIAALSGGFSGLLGTLLSATVLNVPTGPMIVLVLGSLFLFSLLFAPREGIVSRWKVTQRLRHNIRHYQALIHVYEHPGEIRLAEASLDSFVAKGYLASSPKGWVLTALGTQRVEALKRVILDES